MTTKKTKKMEKFKYEAYLHVNANKSNVKCIGSAKANSIKELKKLAKKKAQLSGNFGRIHVSTEDREFFVNA